MRPFVVSTLIVFTMYFVSQNPKKGFDYGDGGHYAHIAAEGYVGDAKYTRELAFFPVYPLLGRLVGSLVLVSNLCLLGALLIPNRAVVGKYALWAFALSPCAFFFHLRYSESTLILATFLCLYKFPGNAFWTGLCTAIRPVGVAMLLPLWNQPRKWLLGCWGLLAYMGFQWWFYGDLLLFAKVQENWHLADQTSVWVKIQSLMTLEPLWSVYLVGDSRYWTTYGGSHLQFMNPIYWGATCILVAAGWRKKWITRDELLVSIGLLLIPYLTKAHENAMLSHARFAAIVFPAYIVVGLLLEKLPRWLAIAFLVASASVMGFYALEYFNGKEYF